MTSQKVPMINRIIVLAVGYTMGTVLATIAFGFSLLALQTSPVGGKILFFGLAGIFLFLTIAMVAAFTDQTFRKKENQIMGSYTFFKVEFCIALLSAGAIIIGGCMWAYPAFLA